MIKNIVFDMGQVLTGFDPDEIIVRFTSSREDIALLRRAIFDTKEWSELDRGTLVEEEMISPACAMLPERLHGAAGEILRRWREYMTPMDDLVPLAEELHKAGYPLYLLSNAGKSMLGFTEKLPVLRLFSGILFSAEVLMIKPEPGIYREFFRRFSLMPEECFFIDDRPENIAAGRAFGMDGFCYGGEVPPLCAALKKAGVKIG